MAFYTTKNDLSLANEQILKDVDVYIQKFEYTGTGVASIVTNDVTFTPATSPAWTTNEFASTVALNIVTLGDSSAVVEALIDSNDATSLTFDATNGFDVSDGTAAAASDFTATSSYDFYALTKSDENEFGDYFGWTNEVNISLED